jgi:hypothetical protein
VREDWDVFSVLLETCCDLVTDFDGTYSCGSSYESIFRQLLDEGETEWLTSEEKVSFFESHDGRAVLDELWDTVQHEVGRVLLLRLSIDLEPHLQRMRILDRRSVDKVSHGAVRTRERQLGRSGGTGRSRAHQKVSNPLTALQGSPFFLTTSCMLRAV